jgi:hypothetical protein
MRSDYRRLEDRAGHTKYLVRRISERACITEPLELGGAADAGVFADEVLRTSTKALRHRGAMDPDARNASSE